MATTQTLPKQSSSTPLLLRPFRFHLALAAGLALLTALFCGREISDPDIWWHMQNAKLLFSTHHIVSREMFSFTALNAPWINHEWLSEIPFYLFYRAFGYQGVFAVTLLLAEASVLGTFYVTYRATDNVKGAFLFGCLQVMLAVVNFGPRTIIFGWLCLIILMRLVHRVAEGRNDHWWYIPVLFAFWVNLHGSWSIGLFLFAVMIVPGFLNLDLGVVECSAWTPQQKKHFIRAAIGSAAAVFCNPYAYKLVLYPLDMAFKQKLNVGHIQEWAATNFAEPRGKVAFILLAITFLAFALSRFRPRLDELLLIGFVVYVSLVHVRFLYLASIVLAPIVARRFTFVPPYDPEIDKPKLNAVIVLGVLIAIAIRFPSVEVLKSDLSKNYPDQALSLLKQRAPHSRVMNEYVWGGYMIWNTPELPTFIDSRADVFEYNGTFADYLNIISIDNSLELLDKQRIDYVLFHSKTPLAYLLQRTPAWEQIYSDDKSVLFARRKN